MNIFMGKFPVSSGWFDIESENSETSFWDECFIGQKNGLCGTAFPGRIFFRAGSYTGNINLEVNVFQSEPRLEVNFTEIVEASFEVKDSSFGLNLNNWDEDIVLPMNLEARSYRVRYSVIDFGRLEKHGQSLESIFGFDGNYAGVYKVDIWPGPIEKDKVIKLTDDLAKYWHLQANT